MPVDLSAPLAWKTAQGDALTMLQTLQGNILKGHGRHFTANIFFRLDPSKDAEARRMLRELGNYHVTSAYRQLLDADQFKKDGKKAKGGKGGGAFVHVALSASGYAALNRPDAAPVGSEYTKGMAHPDNIADLTDPLREEWEENFRTDIHGLVIAALETASETGALAGQIRTLIEEAGGTVFIQHGAALFNAAGEGIEHFGYVDGRSQPLVLTEDIDEERKSAGTDRWDPAFTPGIALVPDPGVPGEDTAFGSFLVFRKLEQSVRKFKTREQEVADELGLEGEDRELAGALIVGRFEDGTPVTMSRTARSLKPPNNFDYQGDSALRCPFHGHIRKTNPRGSGGVTGDVEQDEIDERTHLMLRRGIPYEDTRREVPPSELPESESMEEFLEQVSDKLPEKGVGLLFMAYNADLHDQFRFTQVVWANNSGFPVSPAGPHGIDPVIGQDGKSESDHETSQEQALRKTWDDQASPVVREEVGFSGFVTMKGGEYFFAPSLTFLRGLTGPPAAVA